MLRYYNIKILYYRRFLNFKNRNVFVRVVDRRTRQYHVECVRVSNISIYYQIPLIGN